MPVSRFNIIIPPLPPTKRGCDATAGAATPAGPSLLRNRTFFMFSLEFRPLSSIAACSTRAQLLEKTNQARMAPRIGKSIFNEATYIVQQYIARSPDYDREERPERRQAKAFRHAVAKQHRQRWPQYRNPAEKECRRVFSIRAKKRPERMASGRKTDIREQLPQRGTACFISPAGHVAGQFRVTPEDAGSFRRLVQQVRPRRGPCLHRDRACHVSA